MIGELGHLALITALVIATIQATLPIVGATRGKSGWMRLARPAAQVQCALVAMAFGCLVAAFVVSDFSLAGRGDAFEHPATARLPYRCDLGARTKALC